MYDFLCELKATGLDEGLRAVETKLSTRGQPRPWPYTLTRTLEHTPNHPYLTPHSH